MAFQFRLQAVQKVYEFQRDAEKQTLSDLLVRQKELLQEEEMFQQKLVTCQQERGEWMRAGVLNVEQLQSYFQFEARLTCRLAELACMLKSLAEQVESQRENLLNSEREVKKFEKLEEKQREAYRKMQRERE